MPIHAVVCYIRKEGEILLQKKEEKLFGGRKWNAPGGKINHNEKPGNAAIREVFEETGLKVNNLKDHGKLNFYFGKRTKPDWIVYVFSTRSFIGSLKTSREGLLKWVKIEQLPYDNMWEDDKYWLPLLFENKVFEGNFYFDKKANTLLDHSIQIK